MQHATDTTYLHFDLAEFAHATAALQKQQAIQTWKELNAIAEPSWGEVRTSAYVEARARKLSIPVTQLPGSHTRIIRIKGTGSGPYAGTLAYKVDLDALPYKRANGTIEYRHTCFHSGHLSIALAVMETAWELRERFNAELIFIFQTAEETPRCGARELINAPLWQELHIDRMIALHASPELRFDQVAIREGYAQAGIDAITFTVAVDSSKIKSSHVAKPHAGANTIWAAMKLATQIKFMLAETCNPVQPMLFNMVQFGSSNFGVDNVNVTPDNTLFIVNLRVFDMNFKAEIMEKIQRMVDAIELEYNGLITVDMKIEAGPDPVFNDSALANQALQYATEVLGANQVSVAELRMGGDDVGVYSQILPVVMIRLGTGNPENHIVTDLHNEHFTVDTNCFTTGIAVMTYSVLRALGIPASEGK